MASATKAAKTVFDQNIQRSKHFMDLRRDLLAAGKTEKQVEDMLRAALSWTVAALDAYVYDKVSEEVVGFIKMVLSMPSATEKELEAQNKVASDLITFLEKQEKAERPGHLAYWGYAQSPLCRYEPRLRDSCSCDLFRNPAKLNPRSI